LPQSSEFWVELKSMVCAFDMRGVPQEVNSNGAY
jgi:hypothetical protein